MKGRIILSIIVLLGFLVRVWNLGDNPPGFFADEASIGVNAYSLLTTGADEHNASWPLFFKAFGEYKSPIQIYSTIPFIAVFGLNEFAVRLPSAIYGTLTIIVIYFLTQELFSRSSLNLEPRALSGLPLTAAALLAISPWHIHFSRVAFELMPFIFFTALATYLFLKSLNQASNLYLLFSIFAFILSLYSYFPARIFVPLFVLGLTILLRQELRQSFSGHTILGGGVLFFLLSFPMIFHLLSGAGLARFRQVSIFAQENLSPTQKLNHVAANYFSHFSPTFLLTRGDIDFPGQFITRHSIRGMGELYFWQAPLIILGVLYLLKSDLNFKRLLENKIILKILGLWLTLYPLGSAVTTAPGPQATRSIIGVIPFQILSAVGLTYLFKLLKHLSSKSGFWLLTYGFILIILSNFSNYLHLYFVKYPRYAADFWGWQYGPREIIKYFQKEEKNYDELIMSGDFNAAYIFFKFYAPNNCQKCRLGDLGVLNLQKRQLFALKPKEVNLPSKNLEIKKQIFYPDGQLAFIIFTLK